VPNRRERLRAQTARDILAAARVRLVRSGPQGIALRAIARDLGMTAPGLYRYFGSLDELLGALITTLYDELADAVRAARDAAPAGDLREGLLAASRAFRRWAMDHPSEFALCFGSPIPGFAGLQCDPADEAGHRFEAVFAELFAELWRRQPFPVPDDDGIDPRLADQLAAYAARTGFPLPLGALQVFLSCWIRLYGIVSLEAFGHLRYAFDDGEPMFEAELADLGARLGLR